MRKHRRHYFNKAEKCLNLLKSKYIKNSYLFNISPLYMCIQIIIKGLPCLWICKENRSTILKP